MSNALAIATVTETLRTVLSKNLSGAMLPGAKVMSLRPDDPALQAADNLPNVNIFLYQVAPNTAWRNADLPTRRVDGSLLRRPQVAFDLHYLLSFRGNSTEYEDQRLLGAVARALHTQPSLQRADIQGVEQRVGSSHLNSHLSEQVDLVRFTPVNFSLEEMSKLWSVFLKTDYVLSVAYTATVVLIETDDPPPNNALPVLRPVVQAVPFNLTVIESVDPQAVLPSPPAPLTITLRGRSLSSNDIVEFITPGHPDPIPGTINPGSNSGSMSVTLPPSLRPGVNTVQLIQTAPVSSPPSSPLRSTVLSQSNVAAFVILPALISVDHASPPGQLRAVVSPPAGPKQQVSLLLNQDHGSRAFLLPANKHDTQTNIFMFDTIFQEVPLPAGTYLVRVRVDSAESRLTVNPSGTFSGPTVVL